MKPPEKAIAFLRWFCREDYIEEIEGDLTEIFEKRIGNLSAHGEVEAGVECDQVFKAAILKALAKKLSTKYIDHVSKLSKSYASCF